MKFGALRKFALTQANQQQVASRRPPVTPHDERMVPKCVQLKFNTWNQAVHASGAPILG